MIEFTVYGTPQPKGSTRAFMPKGARFPVVTSDNPNLKRWEKNIRSYLAGLMAAVSKETRADLWAAPIAIEVHFHLPVPKKLARKSMPLHVKRPDLDKLVRGAIDPLIGVVFKDDSQVASIRATKQYAENGVAKVDFLVEAMVTPLTVREALAIIGAKTLKPANDVFIKRES
jgi:crossover junction endodeoxyribonuclease RusA